MARAFDLVVSAWSNNWCQSQGHEFDSQWSNYLGKVVAGYIIVPWWRLGEPSHNWIVRFDS